ncbi:MAG: hypothetical protein AB8G18_19710 [Gammaproteobacteria bacterium]
MNERDRIRQYLARYVSPDSRLVASTITTFNPSSFRRSLCIPAYDESMDFVEALQYHPDIAGTLVILVINAPDNAPGSRLTRTREMLRQLSHTGKMLWHSEQGLMLKHNGNNGEFTILVMDHCSEGRCLPFKQGVGAARKLGNDVALELWNTGLIESGWLYQTDADATLPDNYFVTPETLPKCVAVHLDFQHTDNGETSLAQQLYDLKLDYYTTGLVYAGSPYAHYSLGSALIINANAYAVVRGYPKRSAGEDFYILNKLAKYGRIAFDSSRTIMLKERLSTRVLFGTGPGVLHFQNLDTPLLAEEFYAPESFTTLKIWLSFLLYSARHCCGDSAFNARSAFQHFAGSSATTIAIRALTQRGLFDWLERIVAKYESPEQALQQVRSGMDALKTLQLIHALRDSGYRNVAAVTAKQWLVQEQEYRQLEQPELRSNRYSSITCI